MSLDPSKRLRFGGSKSRKGCLTCIERHLKCDEGQPSCQRCTKAGRNCKQRRSSSDSLRIVHYQSGPSTALSLYPDLETTEQRHFDFFRGRTALELSGVHYDERWLAHLFRVAASEPAIYHAAAAVGALHEHFENGLNVPEPITATHHAPLKQYSKAINTLVETLTRPGRVSQDIALLACLMFCAFESMSFHLHSALSHIHSGLKILAEKAVSGRSIYDRVVPCSELNAMFSRINVQLLELGDSNFDSTNIRLLGPDETLGDMHDVPNAQRMFNPLLNNILHKLHNMHHRAVDLNHPATTEEFSMRAWLIRDMEAYQRWRKGFDAVVAAQVGSANKQHICSMIVLQLRRMCLNLMLGIDLQQGEMGFDDFTEEFEIMVQLAEEFLLHQSVPWLSGTLPLLARSVSEPTPADIMHSLSASEKLSRPNHGTRNVQSGFLVVHPSQTPLVDSTVAADEEGSKSASTIIARSQDLRRLPNGTLPGMPQVVKPTFSMAHGVVYPLHCIVSRCRAPFIRRKALTLLRTCNRREGLWDSGLAARMGNNIVEVEEGRTLQLLHDAAAATWIPMDQIKEISNANEIPNGYRVRLIRPSFLPDRKSIEQYFFSWSGPWEQAKYADETYVQEIMEW